MRIRIVTSLMVTLFALSITTPAFAQEEEKKPGRFGGLVGKVKGLKDLRISKKDGNKAEGTEDGATAEQQAPAAPTGLRVVDEKSTATPLKLKDGEAGVISTPLSTKVVTTKVKKHFDDQNVAYSVDPDTGRILTEWGPTRHCHGFAECKDRAFVQIVSEGGQTELRVRVMEQKVEAKLKALGGGTTTTENPKSNGDATSKLTAELQALLNGTSVIATK